MTWAVNPCPRILKGSLSTHPHRMIGSLVTTTIVCCWTCGTASLSC